MTDWDDRFASGDYPRAPEPSEVLRSDEPAVPDGRALDVAAGTGRNAVFLAEAGYAVDALDRFADPTEALVPGGYLFVEGHPRSADPTPSGPSTDRYRFAGAEPLRAGLGLTVLYYDETTEERPDDRRRATVRLLARRSGGGRQSYPPRPDAEDGGEGGGATAPYRADG